MTGEPVLRGLFLFCWAVSGCGGKAQPERPVSSVVVLDGRYGRAATEGYCNPSNRWYKENAEQIKAAGCEKMSAEVFGGFEDDLVREFALEPECSGVLLVRYDDLLDKAANEARSKPYWDLEIDFNPNYSDFLELEADRRFEALAPERRAALVGPMLTHSTSSGKLYMVSGQTDPTPTWTLNRSSGTEHLGGKVDGTGAAKQIVRAVCTIAKGRGAMVVN